MHSFMSRIITSVLFFFCFTGALIAQAAEDVIPDVPEQLPWWISVLQQFLGQFPDLNGWIVVFFVVISAIIGAAQKILSAIADKTETDKDDNWLKIVNRLSTWAEKILEWINTPVKPKPKE